MLNIPAVCDSRNPSLLTKNCYTGVLMYNVLYNIFLVFLLFLCFFSIPIWAWFIGKRRVLAVVLVLIGIGLQIAILFYIAGTALSSDHGFEFIFNLFLSPISVFAVQFIIYIICRDVRYTNAN